MGLKVIFKDCATTDSCTGNNKEEYQSNHTQSNHGWNRGKRSRAQVAGLRVRRDPQFNQEFQAGSQSISNDCKVAGSCTGQRGVFDNIFSNQIRGKRSTALITGLRARRDPQFNQEFQAGSQSINNDCKVAGSCTGQHGVIDNFFNNPSRGKRSAASITGLRVRRAAQFNQQYQAGSLSINNDCKTSGSCTGRIAQFDQISSNPSRGKRSTPSSTSLRVRRDAQFNQEFQAGSQSISNDCKVAGSCTGQRGVFDNIFSNQIRGKRSTASSTSLRVRRDAQFNQNFEAGSKSISNTCKTVGTCTTGFFQFDFIFSSPSRGKRSTAPITGLRTKRDAQFNQEFQSGSQSISNNCRIAGSCTVQPQLTDNIFNNPSKGKRSTAPITGLRTKRAAQFNQHYQTGSNSVSNECQVAGSCNGGFAQFGNTYSNPSIGKRSTAAIAGPRSRRDAKFNQEFQAGSNSFSNDSDFS